MSGVIQLTSSMLKSIAVGARLGGAQKEVPCSVSYAYESESQSAQFDAQSQIAATLTQSRGKPFSSFVIFVLNSCSNLLYAHSTQSSNDSGLRNNRSWRFPTSSSLAAFRSTRAALMLLASARHALIISAGFLKVFSNWLIAHCTKTTSQPLVQAELL